MKAGPKWSGHDGAADPDRLADRPGPPASAEVVVVAADQKPANMVLADPPARRRSRGDDHDFRLWRVRAPRLPAQTKGKKWQRCWHSMGTHR